ncbi:MAG: DNA primase [Candidatus Moranbacteria bacterium]|nr:DNA primase [Candidatus Moranbacteria bacterium]
MDSIVPEVKSRLNIVDVVGSYLRLTKSGTHWKACCPFHNEKSPSFMVNEERQMFHCFGCGKGGDMFSFVQEIEGIDFREALKLLADRAGVEVPEHRRTGILTQDGVERPDRGREILELTTKFFEKQLREGEGSKTALPYLRKRGISDESLATFRVGYSLPGWRHLNDFLVSRGYDPDELEEVGLVIAKDGRAGYYDRFRDRITFPITDIVGRIIGYSARVAPGSDESQAKYINTPETPLYHKSRAIYGIFQAKQAIKEVGETILVEGQMDVIACHQAGIRNTVAASGTALTGEHLDILKRYGNGIRLFFDMDGAGQEAAWKGTLLALGKEMSVSIVVLTEGKDAADAALENPEALRVAIRNAVPAPEFFLNRFADRYDISLPEGKKMVASDFAPLLSAMNSDIDRNYWRQQLSSRLRVEERALIGVLRRSDEDRARDFGRTRVEAKEDVRAVGASFSRRSDTVRDSIIGLLLSEANLLKDIRLPEAVREYLSLDPIYTAIVAKGGVSVTDSFSDEAMKRRAAGLLFEADKFVSEEKGYDFELRERRKGVFAELVSQLVSELRKEQLTTLAADIEEAKRNGDKKKEQELLGRLSGMTSKRG